MRLFRPVFPLIFPAVRLREPLVQVWIMAGFSVLLVLIGHLRAWNADGEGKINPNTSASHLLLAGATMAWSDEFGSPQRPTPRPVLRLDSATALPALGPALTAPSLDLRPALATAAAAPSKSVTRPVRAHLTQAALPSQPLQIRVAWNGDLRGNAALIAARQPAASDPSTLTFVIGNGSRSGDGEIQCLPAGSAPASGLINIILIGPNGRTSPRQLAALAELLVYLEATSGHPIAPCPPQASSHARLLL